MYCTQRKIQENDSKTRRKTGCFWKRILKQVLKRHRIKHQNGVELKRWIYLFTHTAGQWVVRLFLHGNYMTRTTSWNFQWNCLERGKSICQWLFRVHRAPESSTIIVRTVTLQLPAVSSIGQLMVSFGFWTRIQVRIQWDRLTDCVCVCVVRSEITVA